MSPVVSEQSPIVLAPGADVTIDFGAAGVGGYPSFTVLTNDPAATLRISYACHPDGLGPKGDFWRETAARYLGADIDLPILPANIDRYVKLGTDPMKCLGTDPMGGCEIVGEGQFLRSYRANHWGQTPEFSR